MRNPTFFSLLCRFTKKTARHAPHLNDAAPQMVGNFLCSKEEFSEWTSWKKPKQTLTSTDTAWHPQRGWPKLIRKLRIILKVYDRRIGPWRRRAPSVSQAFQSQVAEDLMPTYRGSLGFGGCPNRSDVKHLNMQCLQLQSVDLPPSTWGRMFVFCQRFHSSVFLWDLL